MNRILLVARRDYRQVVSTRAFKVTLLVVPLMLIVSVLAGSHLRAPSGAAYVMADAGGRIGPAIALRLELERQRHVVRVPVPAGVPQDRGEAAFGRAIAPHLAGDVKTPEGPRALAIALYIPPGGAARIWTNGRANGDLIDAVRDVLDHANRMSAMQAAGVEPRAAARIEALQAPLVVTQAPRADNAAQAMVRSALPLALVYLLLISSLITGGMMLQGVIEERSNRLLEAVLACVEPKEFMIGKLVGLGAVGLTILAVWVGCAVIAAFSFQGAAASILRPSLAALDQPWMILGMLFYFFAGYLMVAMIYLSIGSLSNSMQDAQAYLVPVMMVLVLPVVFLMTAMVQHADGPYPHILSWIPPYTPFAMLARLGFGVSTVELLGTGALLAGFLVLEFVLLGRLFQASLLSTGQPPRLGDFLKLMLRPDQGGAPRQ
ncbi:MAG TPA: ABC transporter permease [Rhizomicrobium sp.]|nr:ABC transporter permease [Rhizomicrobium sp.]